jgi:WD40 repeat protein
MFFLLSGICLNAAAQDVEVFLRQGHRGGVFSVAFSPDGKRIISGSGDNIIRLWDAVSGREIRIFSGHTDSVYSASFSPDGKQAISGSRDRTVKLWDAVSGHEIKTFSGHTNTVLSVTFSPNGKQIISGSGDRTVKQWDAVSGREIRTFLGHTEPVDSVSFSSDGKLIISGSRDGNVKLWDSSNGREIRTFLGHTDGVLSVALSPDGKQAISSSGDSTIRLWDSSSGNEIRTFLGHTHAVRSVMFSPDGKQIISASGDGTVKLWDSSSGCEISTFSGHTHTVYSAMFGSGGKQIVSGSGDGTIRVWDMPSGSENAQFVSFTDGEWMCLTPEGYYNASPKGDQYLNVRVGNNVYGIDQYRATFYRPPIVEARLQGRPIPISMPVIQETPEPPVVVIRSPENGVVLTSGQTELSVSVVDQQQPVKNIKVLVNGRLIGGDALSGISGARGGNLETTGIRFTDNRTRVDFRLPLTLDPGSNRIEVLAENPYSEGRDRVDVNYSQTQQNILPNLWILSIGINQYDSQQLGNLDYAKNDAKEIINVFKTQEGKLYRTVNSRLIADDEAVTPTRANIIDNFAYLKQAGQRDVVMLFIAGHGMNDDSGNFYLMPSDAAFYPDGSIQPSSAISYREIQSVLDAPGQKLVFIDTCHSEGISGNKTRAIDNNQLVRALQNNSTVIFSASRGSERSQESREFGHGIFTYSIIQGMRGAADWFNNKRVTMKELDTYVSEMVPKLTNGMQHPTTSTPDGYVNFVVADLR